VVVRLHTRDAFESAIFYGGVLQWADDEADGCTVGYEFDRAEVVVRTGGSVVARISSGAVEAAPDPLARPHWSVSFAVDDVPAAVERARELGATVVDAGESAEGPWADVRDPEGGLFTVFTRASHPAPPQ
jgi:predicted enzyme related to lactoylglutathione lyase